MPSKYGFGNTRKKSPYKKHGKAMYGADQKNPIMKALVGKQENLPEELKEKILASPGKMYGKKHSPAKGYKSAAQRKAVHASKAEKKESMAKDYKKGYYGA